MQHADDALGRMGSAKHARITLSSLSLTAALAGPISDRVVNPDAPLPRPGT